MSSRDGDFAPQLLDAFERCRKAKTPEEISAAMTALDAVLDPLMRAMSRPGVVVETTGDAPHLEVPLTSSAVSPPDAVSEAVHMERLIAELGEWLGGGTPVAAADRLQERVDKAAADLALALTSRPDEPAALVVSQALTGMAWAGLGPESGLASTPNIAELTQNMAVAGLVLSRGGPDSGAADALNHDVAEMSQTGVASNAMTAREFLHRFGRVLRLPKPASGAPSGRARALPTPLPALLTFRADRAHQSTVEGLSRVAEWATKVQGFFRGLEVTNGRNYRQVIGFRRDPGQELWAFLEARGESAIKAHYALWARCYEATGADPDKYVHISVPQFCDDLGYARHHKGGFRREHKLEAMKLLEALTTAELSVTWQVGTKERRLKGAIWDRGLEGEERDVYSDLFGAARAGDQAMWEPVAFTYKPGPWFADKEWRRHNRYVGVVGLGLLRLDNRRDRWALRIGGYYGSLARLARFTPRTIAVATVLARTGLDRLNAGRPGEQETAFKRAHQRLCEVGVLKGWEYLDEAPEGEPNMDDPEDLAVLADYRAGDWRRKRVTLTWPDEVSTVGLLADKRRHALEQAPTSG